MKEYFIYYELVLPSDFFISVKGSIHIYSRNEEDALDRTKSAFPNFILRKIVEVTK
jgi:hypothetical protein